MADNHSNSTAHGDGHVPSRMPYFVTFGLLLVLTAATVAVAEVNLGPLNDIVAMAIAVTKGTLVVLFFMHVRHSSNLTKMTVVSGFLWLAIMVVVTMTDYWTRGWFGTFFSSQIQ